MPSNVAAGAGLLAIAALALLAGHAWSVLILIPSHVTLAGRIAPTLTHSSTSPSLWLTVFVLVTALPAMWLGLMLMPRVVPRLIPRRRPPEPQ